jgi:hypothetical protein
MHTEFWQEWKNQLNDLGVNRIIGILVKQDVAEWTVFIGIRKGTYDGLL